MAKKQQATLTLEGDMLTHARNAWGKTSPIFGGQKGKVVTLLNASATLMGEWLQNNPVIKAEDIPAATELKHEIKRKDENAAGWTWLTLNGRIEKDVFDKLTELGFSLSKKRSDSAKGVYKYYATKEVAEKAVRKVVKL